MEYHVLYIVALIGAGCLAAVFFKMKTGIGPYNLRVIGIILIATLATVLAIARQDSLNSAMGILGAIAGYLFGIQDNGKNQQPADSSVATGDVGDHNKIAGRDINETIENLSTQIAKFDKQINKIENKITNAKGGQNMDYLLNTVYDRDPNQLAESFEKSIRCWEKRGWELVGFSSDYSGMDGIILLFSKQSESVEPKFEFHHGSYDLPG